SSARITARSIAGPRTATRRTTTAVNLSQRCDPHLTAGVEVADGDRHGLRKEDGLPRGRSHGRLLAQQPTPQPLCILQADTAVAEAAVVLGEELLPGRVV